jgi:hypothetical protein
MIVAKRPLAVTDPLLRARRTAKPRICARSQFTPGVVIEERVVHAGGVPSRQKVESWLHGEELR